MVPSGRAFLPSSRILSGRSASSRSTLIHSRRFKLILASRKITDEDPLGTGGEFGGCINGSDRAELRRHGNHGLSGADLVAGLDIRDLVRRETLLVGLLAMLKESPLISMGSNLG